MVKRRKSFSEEQEKQMCDDYILGLKKSDVMKKYNIPQKHIEDIFKKNNVSMRSNKTSIYSLNENFFEEINTKEKAYILGFLYADGCIIKPHNSSHHVVLSIHIKDSYILDKINKIINHNRPLYIRKDEKYDDVLSLFISSDKMVNDLLNLGMGERKSFNLNYPKHINQELQSHFLRGLFDGDGCISINENKTRGTWNIVGTPEICQGVHDQLSLVGIKSSVNNRPYFSGPHASVSIANKENIKKVFEYLYEDSELLFLSRKYEKLLLLSSKFNKKNDRINKIKKLLLLNFSIKKISEMLNIKLRTVYYLKNKDVV